MQEEEEVWRLDWLDEASGSTSDTVLGVVPWHHERYDDGTWKASINQCTTKHNFIFHFIALLTLSRTLN